MKTTKQLNKEIKELEETGLYFANQTYTEDGIPHWKISDKIYRQSGTKWEEIENKPKVCNTIRIGRGGVAY